MSFAFFDVDDTLIRIKSMFDFFPFWCDRQGQPDQLPPFLAAFAEAAARGQPREDLNRLYYRFFAGVPEARLIEVGQLWADDRFGPSEPAPAALVAPVVDRLRAHQAQGVTPVFVSGSMPALLAPLGRRLGVGHWLCTRQEVDDHGILTGRILPPQTIGAGKAAAMGSFLAARGVSAGDCFAYGDDLSDAPMLDLVGHPLAVIGSPALADLARRRGWPTLATAIPDTVRNEGEPV